MEKRNSVLTKRHMVILVTLFCCLLWGSAFPMIVLGYEHMNVNLSDPFQVILFAGIRFLLAAGMIFLYAFATKENMGINFRQFRGIFVLGIIQTFIQYMLFFFSLRTTHPANGSILSSTGIFFAVIFSHFLYKNDRLNVQKIVGLVLGLAGIVILTGGGVGSFSFTGEGFMILAMMFGAVGGVYTKKLTKDTSPVAITAYQFLFGSILLILLGITFANDVAFTFTATSTSLLVYKGFISAAAFTLFSALLKYNEVSKVAVFKFSIPVFGVFISFLFFGETLHVPTAMVSMTLVAIGILLINMEGKPKFLHGLISLERKTG